ERHTGAGADGLIAYEAVDGGASMRLLNADGSRAEVSGNGVRGLAAILLRDTTGERAAVAITTDAGIKTLTRTGGTGVRQTFRASMGAPDALRPVTLTAAGESIQAVVLDMGNPQ